MVTAASEYEAQRSFEEMMDLWSNGKYEELWESGTDSSKARIWREDFVTIMNRSPRVPDVGWMRERSISVTMKSPSSALVRAEIGFIIDGQDTQETRVFQLFREGEEWRISLDEFVNLARPLEYGY
jgi:hypothetical protein